MKMPVVNLTPFERARLKLVEYVAYAVIINALIALVMVLSQGNKIDWSVLRVSILSASALVILQVLSKYFKAHGDAPLVIALDAASQQVEARLHVDAATLTIPDLPVDLEPTQQTTAPGPVLSGITESVGGADTLPRLPTVTTKVLQ